MKEKADWYTKGRIERDVKKHVREKFAKVGGGVAASGLTGKFLMEQAVARSQAAQNEAWRNKRVGRVQPTVMEGLFIAKEVQKGTLVLGFREEGTGDTVYGVQLISFNPNARTPSDHGTSPFIGKYVRVTIEEIP